MPGKWGGVGIERAPIRLSAACIVLQLRLRRVPQPKNGHFPPFSAHCKAQRISSDCRRFRPLAAIFTLWAKTTRRWGKIFR